MSSEWIALGTYGWTLLIALCVLLAKPSPALGRRLAPRVVQGSVVVGSALATLGLLLFGAERLDPGVAHEGSGLVADHLSSWFDLMSAGLAGILSIRLRRLAIDAIMPYLLLLWLGASAACLAAHTGDLLSLVLCLEVAASGALFVRARASDVQPDPAVPPGRAASSPFARAMRGQLLFAACGLLGVTLVFGATADLDLAGLANRVAKVFNQWGGVQRWHATLLEQAQRMPPGMLAQARGKVISGMAPASLLLPGVLFLLVAVLGRLLAPGGVAAPQRVYTRLIALIIFVRVFVGMLYAPRMVNEPYGWVGPLASVAVVWMIIYAVAAFRSERVHQLIDAMGQMQLGLLLLVLIVAANYYGHRAMADGPLSATIEVAWAHRAGDDALAAALSLASVCFIASAASQVWVHPHPDAGQDIGPDGGHCGGQGLWSLDGLVRTHPASGQALLLILFALVALPGGAVFGPFLAVLRSLVEHSVLRPLVLLVAILMLGPALRCLHVAYRLVWARPAKMLPSETFDQHPMASEAFPIGQARGVAWVVAFALLIVGLAPNWLLSRTAIAAAGVSQRLASEERAQWVKSSRARWAGEAPSAGRNQGESRPDDETSSVAGEPHGDG